MLGKPKKPENDAPFTAGKIIEEKPTAPSPPPPPPPRPASPTSEEKTTIGQHIAIEGQIRGKEHLVIEGSMKGNVQMENHNFTVGANGRVDGEVRAQNVAIAGQLKGTINAMGKVEVTKEADFYGDIKAKSISVEDGAYFKGSIELNREPHRKSAFADAAKGPPSPEPAKAAFSQPTDAKKES
ncbi:MAG: polymer-forming cytoskeletal protein [Desulfobacterales bacterium]|nr:MAG: polymer-forming cytoskeletal protein [Desulfobacterales bacterium]